MNVKSLQANEEIPKRKAHIGFVYGSYLYIHGGLNDNETPDGRMYALNLTQNKWEEVIYTENPEPVYHHKAVVVGKNLENEAFIQKYVRKDLILENFNRFTREEGRGSIPNPETSRPTIITTEKKDNRNIKVFIFGGFNQKNETTNNFRLLERTSDGFKMNNVSSKGQKPRERAQHGMCFVNHLSALAVFGGRYSKPSEQIDYLMNDLHLFYITKSTWIQINYGKELDPRSSLEMVDLENGDLVIFGGTGQNNFFDGSFLHIALKQNNQSFFLS